MNDIDKVIEGLDCCVNHLGSCRGCPYDEGPTAYSCGYNLYIDTLAIIKVLIKARGPQNPICDKGGEVNA